MLILNIDASICSFEKLIKINFTFERVFDENEGYNLHFPYTKKISKRIGGPYKYYRFKNHYYLLVRTRTFFWIDCVIPGMIQNAKFEI